MAQQYPSLLRPYMLLLREGEDIDKNLLDYKLVMVQMHNRECLGSSRRINPPMPNARIATHPSHTVVSDPFAY